MRRGPWQYVLPIAAVLLVWLGVAAPATPALARWDAATAVTGRLPGVAHQPDGVVTHDGTASGRSFVATAERSDPLLGMRCAACTPAAVGHLGGTDARCRPADQSHAAAHRSRAPPVDHE